MKITKSLLIAVMAAGFMSGCASTPKEDSEGSDTSANTTDPLAVWSSSAEQTEAEKAIASAKASVKAAKSNQWLWRDTGKILKKAEEAYDKGDYAKASKLAKQAERQADSATNQYHLESAKDIRRMISGYSLDDAQQARLRALDANIAAADGRVAHDKARILLAQLKSSAIRYDVVKGDSLWRISGKADIYGNPYQWPLIYKQNADQIKDADLIYPGQRFDISRSPSASDVNAAVRHAKTRGAWSVGNVEASDRGYLGN